ncbi:MAG: hypothetical protein Q9223_000106 [Gallowayella weberi]
MAAPLRSFFGAPCLQSLRYRQHGHINACLRRNFSQSIQRNAARNPKPATKAPKIYQAPSKPIRSPASGSYKSFTQTLAERSEPVLLYQSASHTIYMAGCYGLGFLILAYIVHVIPMIKIWTPTGYGRYLKIAYNGMLAIASGVSMVLIMKPYRIIQSIQAIPVLQKGSQRTLHLQIESIRMFPGIKPKTVSIPIHDVRLPLFQERSNAELFRLAEARRIDAEKIRGLRQGNYMLLPLRQLGFHLSKGFRDLKHAFTKNPFVYLHAKGFNRSWKLDRGAGWVLDDGRALDRIMMSR